MFNYTCEECGKGIVKKKVLEDYRTRIKGRPFIVDKATVGICERCGARHFDASETKRWEKLYNKQLEDRSLYLSPQEITDVRTQLSLSMETFAYLLGCTRQSIYNWEKKDRETPQSRMADLLIKLVRDSAREGKIDVVGFLVQEAAKIGTPVRIVNVENVSNNPIRLELKRMSRESIEPSNNDMKLAASDQENEVFVAESADQTFRGLLRYEFSSADLSLQILHDALCLRTVNVQVITNDGKQFDQRDVSAEGSIPLILKTPYREHDVKEIVLEPLAVRSKEC